MFGLFKRGKEEKYPVRYPAFDNRHAYNDRRQARQIIRREYVAPDIEPNTLFENMLSQNHLLIAGMPGSGKSVIANALIFEGLKRTPKECKFVLIDPKRVELCMYKRLPHVMAYASDIDDICNALQDVANLMDERYNNMANTGKRKYAGAHIYIVIDELADLMLTAKKRVEPILLHLLQLGRAARIHVVMCTQCPLSTIISTPIKCCCDARIGLHTRNARDSRNIIDMPGCENLPRYGKAIYITPEATKTVNVPMVTDDQITDIIEYWTR